MFLSSMFFFLEHNINVTTNENDYSGGWWWRKRSNLAGCRTDDFSLLPLWDPYVHFSTFYSSLLSLFKETQRKFTKPCLASIWLNLLDISIWVAGILWCVDVYVRWIQYSYLIENNENVKRILYLGVIWFFPGLSRAKKK